MNVNGIDQLAPISLDALVATADLQTRKDRKYVVPVELLDDLVDELVRRADRSRVLEIDGTRTFAYQSAYFDTPDRVSFLGSARRRPRRFKVRTRSYLDTEVCALEVKTRDGRQQTVKHRLPYSFGDRLRLTRPARRFIAGVDQAAAVVEELSLALITSYRRTTLVADDDRARITIDTDLRWAAITGATITLADWALIETKTSGAPCAFDRTLWRRGRRPATISKYCTGLAALDPDVPANKWHRVLRRYFDGTDTRLCGT